MIGTGRTVDVGPWVKEVLALDPGPTDARFALALRRASQVLADIDPDSAVRLARQAITALDELQDPVGMVRALGDHVLCAARCRAVRRGGRGVRHGPSRSAPGSANRPCTVTS